MGDDIGWAIGAYNQGIMSMRTPNLDRRAAEGMRFTDDQQTGDRFVRDHHRRCARAMEQRSGLFAHPAIRSISRSWLLEPRIGERS